MDDLGNAVEQAAVLTQHIFTVFGPRELHMHEALTAPGERERERDLGLLKEGGRERQKQKESNLKQ